MKVYFGREQGWKVRRIARVIEDPDKLKTNPGLVVHEALETHLSHEPTKVSRNRTRRLGGLVVAQSDNVI